MAASRYLLQHFALANPLYINATVTAYTVSGGAKTTTKATLYADETGSTTLQNPQKLDSTGKFTVPIYIAVPVVLTIDGFGNVPEHDTGVIAGSILFGEANATAAAASQTAAAASATAAAGSATAASASASSASSSAASSAASAANLTATSTTSLLIAAASKTFVTQSGKQFAAGQFVLASSAADPANYMHGQVTSYAGTSLVVNVTNVGGSGTLADWNLSISGSRGASGTSSAGGSNGQIQVNSSGSLDGIDATGTGNVIRASALSTYATQTYADTAAATAAAGVSTIEGQFKNLYVRNGGSPLTQIAVTADALVLANASNVTKIVRGASVTINTGSSGANGVDSGTVAANTWYSVWAISDGTTTAGLISTSSTAPTLPGAYTYKMRLGWVRTDGSSNLLLIYQYGRRCQYTIPRSMASGVAGTLGINTNAIALGAFIPVTASVLYGIGVMNTGGTNNSVGMEIAVSSGGLGIFVNYPNSSTGSGCFSCIPESSNLYWSSGGSSNSVLCQGWEDNI